MGSVEVGEARKDKNEGRGGKRKDVWIGVEAWWGRVGYWREWRSVERLDGWRGVY